MEWVKKIGFLLGPALFLTLMMLGVGADDHKLRVLAVAAWMLSWWITEPVPIYVTAMLPMVFFPALDIMPVADTFMPYANPIIFLFLGGFVIALAMEEHKLHERIAFSLVRVTGTRSSGIIFGFMISTAFVAMWISNTATSVMMLPIAMSVIGLLGQKSDGQAQFKRFATVFMLSIAYSASIGGVMTLIGTPPNVVFAGFYANLTGEEFSFIRWMGIGTPVGVAMLLLGFVLLTRLIYPIHNFSVEGASSLFEAKWSALGKMSKGEKLVTAMFLVTVAGWVMLNPINEWLGFKALNNTNVAMFGGLMMFVIPLDFKNHAFLLPWKSTTKLPWGILILFGGGLALADGLEKAGTIDFIARFVADHFNASPILVCAGLTVLAIAMTEVMSNVALVTVLIPVVFGLAKTMNIDPVFLAVPVTLAASCAFMMPISTPPNAVVYSSGYFTVGQMMKAGLLMNLMAALVIVLICWSILG